MHTHTTIQITHTTLLLRTDRGTTIDTYVNAAVRDTLALTDKQQRPPLRTEATDPPPAADDVWRDGVATRATINCKGNARE